MQTSKNNKGRSRKVALQDLRFTFQGQGTVQEGIAADADTRAALFLKKNPLVENIDLPDDVDGGPPKYKTPEEYYNARAKLRGK